MGAAAGVRGGASTADHSLTWESHLAGSQSLSRWGLNVVAALLTPQGPIKSEKVQARPHSESSIWLARSNQGREEGLGPYTFCICSNRK